MKNDSNPIIRSEEVTIDMHICAALSESRSSGEIYFAAIAPDMDSHHAGRSTRHPALL